MMYILWGLKSEDEPWKEQILLSRATAAQCDQIEALARRDGFTKFRRTALDDIPPDFAATVAV